MQNLSSAIQPPESPRALLIAHLRPVVNAVLAHNNHGRLLSKEDEARAFALVAEYDRLIPSLRSDPARTGDEAFEKQTRQIGEGKAPKDVFERDELRREARTIIHAHRERLCEISAEVGAIVAPALATFLDLALKTADELEAKERAIAEGFGLPFCQSSISVQLLRDLPRRTAKLIPPAGVNRCVRTMCAPLMEVDPLPVKSELDEHLEAKQVHAKTLAQRVREMGEGAAEERARKIQEANAPKEARKRALSEAGLLQLGTGAPETKHDAPLGPTPDSAESTSELPNA